VVGGGGGGGGGGPPPPACSDIGLADSACRGNYRCSRSSPSCRPHGSAARRTPALPCPAAVATHDVRAARHMTHLPGWLTDPGACRVLRPYRSGGRAAHAMRCDSRAQSPCRISAPDTVALWPDRVVLRHQRLAALRRMLCRMDRRWAKQERQAEQAAQSVAGDTAAFAGSRSPARAWAPSQVRWRTALLVLGMF
jgi:hypothetical protein